MTKLKIAMNYGEIRVWSSKTFGDYHRLWKKPACETNGLWLILPSI